MTEQEFIKALKENFSFTDEDENFSYVELEDDQLLAYDNKVEIATINYYKIDNETLGFRMDRILDLESSNELLKISGTASKDGLYYLNHESILITAEEVEDDECAKEWIEKWMNIKLDEYSNLSPDQKVELFEKKVGIYLLEKTLEEFMSKIAIVSKEKFFK